ncbi:MAG: GGDEF domain-containing protein [Betaproteobacteria bacterium HGW-Betaproteobacteria-10]|nr:MAG: GGDEF domain-containing protein [Betaproteobacteria bacterium HGW-Betaproteobacteria-10]
MTQRQKILLAFILPALIALLSIAVFLEKSHRQLAIERWSSEQKSHVSSIADALQSEITQAENLLAYTAQLDEFLALIAVDRINRQLNGIPPDLETGKRHALAALLAQSPALSTVFLLLPNGDHYLSHPYAVQQSLKKYNLADRPYFQRATKSKKATISDSVIGADGKLAVIIDIPLLDPQGEIYAHLGGVVLLENLSTLIATARITPFDEGMLLDRQGKLIAHSDPGQIGPEGSFYSLKHPLLRAHRETSDAVSFQRWTDESGVEWLGFSQNIEDGWTLLLQRRLSSVAGEYAGAVRETVFLVGVILLITSGIGLAMAFFASRRWEIADQALAQVHDELESRVVDRTRELAASQVEIVRSRDFYLSVLEDFPALIWRAGLDAKCDYFNRTWLEFTGRTREQESGDGWTEGVHPDDLQQCLETYLGAFKNRQPFAMEYRLRRHDGEYRWLLDMGQPFHDINGQFIGYLGTCFDVSERHEAAEKLQLVASVFSHAREGIIITDAQSRIIDVNEAFSTTTGYSRAEALGKNPSFLRSARQKKDFYNALWRALNTNGYWQGELWNRRKNGEIFAELLTISAVKNSQGEVNHYVGIFADITQQKENEARLEKLAHYDPLTGLPNRTLLGDRLYMSIALAQRNKHQLAVCMLDLDGFKHVNDTLGHAAGDQLLIDFAQRMRNELRQTDTLARLGGDEFIFLINELKSFDECFEIIHRIIRSASQPYLLGDEVAEVSASIGITLYPDDGADPDLLLRHADQAMYIAKLNGGNRYFMFDPLKDIAARAERTALDRLQQALDAGEFEMHYQPKVDMQRGCVIGAEALIRWRHPERGLILPGEFLPLTEDTDFAITLSEWVIGEAIRQLNTWHQQGIELTIGINIAPRHLQQPDFAEGLARLLAPYPDLPTRLIELEILETAALHDMTHAAEVIAACQRMGIAFALDDFGTGYSSLLYLKHLPADTLKIDQSFIRNMLHDPENMAIVKGVIGLAEAFNRKVIAEGVETLAHGDALLSIGCTQAQGYGIARPMPAADLAGWISRWQAPAHWLTQKNAGTKDDSPPII